MKIKKIVSAISALTIAVSAFASMAITANAAEVNATLVHTSHVSAGSAGTGQAVDAEKHYYNNEASSGWIAYAFAEFDFVIPEGESIASATLTWSTNQGGNKGRDLKIYYLNPGVKPDYDAIVAGTADNNHRFNGSKTWCADAKTPAVGDDLNKTTDVTSAIKAMASEGNIVFQWTGNAGGAELYGKASAYAPTLTIITSAATLYDVTFAESNGVDATITVNGEDVTNGVRLADGTYSFTATASTHETYTGEFTVEGAAKEVSFEMTPKAAAENITVKYINAENVEVKSETISAEGKYSGNTEKVPYRKYVAGNDGKLYEAAATAQEYGKDVVLNVNTVLEIGVTETAIAEGREFIALVDGDGDSGNNAAVRASNRSAARGTITIGDVEPGIYTLSYNMYLRKSSESEGPMLYLNDEKVCALVTGSSWTSTTETNNIEITKSGTLTIRDCDMTDCVILYKTGDYVAPTATYALEKEYTSSTGDATADNASLFKLTITAGSEAITSVGVKVNDTAADETVETNITGGSAVFAVVVNALADAVTSMTAVINNAEVAATVIE